MRVSSVARPLTFTLTAAALLAGCSSQSSTPTTFPASAQNAAPAQIPFSDHVLPNATATVGVRLTGESPFTTEDYGRVLGYFKGRHSTTSESFSVSANSNVVFVSVDTQAPHTASFLGNAMKESAPWPKTFNGSSKASPAGTAIGTKNFSTGTLQPGAKSAVYSTGAPGFYMFGCFYHYNLDGMRTVIIVK